MILLDTHTWIWWVDDPSALSSSAREVVERAAADAGLAISSISAWEVAMLLSKGRLELTMELADWVRHSQALPFVSFVPVSNRIAIQAVSLPIHPDPADRIIIATAQNLSATLVTKDRKISAYEGVETVW